MAQQRKTCAKCGYRRPSTGPCPCCSKYDQIARRVVSNQEKVAKRIADGIEQKAFVPDLTISLEDFARWLSGRKMVCRYCTIPEELIWHLDIPTQSHNRLTNLGVDRTRNERDYEKGNLSLCCYACNKAKSNQFTDHEMFAYIGPGIARSWLERLEAAGVQHDWSAPERD